MSPLSVAAPDEKRRGTIEVRASSASCTWTAESPATWIEIKSGTPGRGDGGVHYDVSKNNGLTERTATLTIAGAPVIVTQAGKLINLDLDGRISDLTGSCPAMSFTLDEQIIRTSVATLFVGRTCAEIKKNMKAEVTGIRQLDASILAVRVSTEQD